MPRPFVTIGGTLAALMLPLLSVATACEPAQRLQADTPEAFTTLNASTQPIDSRTLDYPLLSEAIFHETNLRRQNNGLQTLDHLAELSQAACVHAQDMVEDDFFAHENPTEPQKATPLDRVESQGLEVGFVAENIAQTFLLQYESGASFYTRQENGETVFSQEPNGDPLLAHTYHSFAVDLLDQWMNSPGHRENILANEPRYLGAGCEYSEDDEVGMPTLTCVQLFFDQLEAS